MSLVLKVTALTILLIGVRLVTVMGVEPIPFHKGCQEILVADPTKRPDKEGWVDAIRVWKCP